MFAATNPPLFTEAAGGFCGDISMPRLGARVGVAAWNGRASALHSGGAFDEVLASLQRVFLGGVYYYSYGPKYQL